MRKLGIDWFDLMVVLGLVLLTVGSWFIYAPLALIVPGVFLLLIGLLGAGRRGGE